MATPEKKARKNSVRCTDKPHLWPEEVWNSLELKMATNCNSKGLPYFKSIPLTQKVEEIPPALEAEQCHVAYGCNNVMICFDGKEYQRPLHRARFLLKLRNQNELYDDSETVQASHLCMDEVNVDGKGAAHCCNPDHMVAEDDKTNKSRQRCAGWIWIHPYGDNAHGFWYPSCTHNPPCIRFTSKGLQPTLVSKLIDPDA